MASSEHDKYRYSFEEYLGRWFVSVTETYTDKALRQIIHAAASWRCAEEGGKVDVGYAKAEPVDGYVKESEYYQLVRQHKALSEVVMKLGARVEELAGQPAMPDFKSHMRVLEIIRTWTDEVVRMSKTRSEFSYDPHALVSLLKECGYEIVTVRKTT